MNKKLSIGLVVLIVIVAGGIVYFNNSAIFQNAGSSPTPAVTQNTNTNVSTTTTTTTVVATPSGNSTTTTTTDVVIGSSSPDVQGKLPILQPNWSADEKAAVSSFGPASTTAENERQITLANKVAKESGFIDVTNCELAPAVLRVKEGADFMLENKGIDPVYIIFTGDIALTVRGKSSMPVTANFGNQKAGLYGFSCRINSTIYQTAVMVY